MKKLMLLGISFFLIFTLSAQKGFYTQVKGGYGWSPTVDYRSSTEVEVGVSDIFSYGNKYSNKRIYGTVGGGAVGNIAVGYMFNDNIGFEIDAGYFKGANKLQGRVDTARYHITQMGDSEQIRISPSFIVSGSSENKFIPYARMGLLIPVWGYAYTYATASDSLGIFSDRAGIPHGTLSVATDATFEARTSGKFSLGFQAAMGCRYKILPYLQVFAEAEFKLLGIRGNETVYTQMDTHSVIGGTILLDRTVDDEYVAVRHYIYKDELTAADNVEGQPGFDYGLPTNRLTPVYNYTAIGISVGIRYNIP